MSGKPIGQCPNPEQFAKWWRGKANRNMETAPGPLRATNFCVTEEDINARFKLVDRSFTKGDVLGKVKACGIPCYALPEEGPPDAASGDQGSVRIGWSPIRIGVDKGTPAALDSQ